MMNAYVLSHIFGWGGPTNFSRAILYKVQYAAAKIENAKGYGQPLICPYIFQTFLQKFYSPPFLPKFTLYQKLKKKNKQKKKQNKTNKKTNKQKKKKKKKKKNTFFTILIFLDKIIHLRSMCLLFACYF